LWFPSIFLLRYFKKFWLHVKVALLCLNMNPHAAYLLDWVWFIFLFLRGAELQTEQQVDGVFVGVV